MKIHLSMDKNDICKIKKFAFKNWIRGKVKSATFLSLKEIQLNYTKVNNIIYSEYFNQPCLSCTSLTFKESSSLFNSRVKYNKHLKNVLHLNVQKLDGVGPVNNRPSTDPLHHFFQLIDDKKKKKI